VPALISEGSQRLASTCATEMSIVISTVAVALGAYIAAFPGQAARTWGSERLDKLVPARRPMFLGLFRALGILICLGGVLFGIDSIAFSRYHR
jgi:hypothetical protein